MQGKVLQQATDLHQLAGMYAKAVQQHTQGSTSSCAIGAVGLCTMLAFELCNQLSQQGRQVELLAVFESAPVSRARQVLPPLDDRVTGELVQVWCVLYQLMVEARSQEQQPQRAAQQAQHPVLNHGQHAQHAQQAQQAQQQHQLPDLETMVQHLYGLQSYEAQLDYIGSFKPGAEEQEAWDRSVHSALSGVLHLMQLLHSYQPDSMLQCPAVLLHHAQDLQQAQHAQQEQHAQHAQHAQQAQQEPPRVVQLLGRIADDCWRQVAPALLPLAAHEVGSRAAATIPVDAVLLEAAQAGMLSDHTSASDTDAQHPPRVVPLNSSCPNWRYNFPSMLQAVCFSCNAVLLIAAALSAALQYFGCHDALVHECCFCAWSVAACTRANIWCLRSKLQNAQRMQASTP